ncbi:hypothetical protein [Sorangium sp. So ce362]|uniref:hypothetical protein n=1 Tax=Sorangium sp. So ce362 TaxID=3133303 RepID=UPI003F64789D
MNHQFRRGLSALLAVASLSAAGQAYANVTVTGDVSPEDPSDPWDLGSSTLLVGGASAVWEPTFDNGEVIVTSGGKLFSAAALVGNNASGTVQVIGYGSMWTNSGSIQLCASGYCDGSLIVRNGAEVSTDELVVGNRNSMSLGRVLVEGYDATLTSRTNTYIGLRARGRAELRQGGRFFSNNVYIGGALGCSVCNGSVTVAGSATRWVSTGEFIVGVYSPGTLDIYRAELSTVNARIGLSSTFSSSKASVSGWGGTWTNQGLLRVGTDLGYGELTLGAYGTLVTEDTEIHSELGGGFIKVNDVYASWLNSGDVTVFAIGNQSPSILVDNGAFVSIGGLLRTAQPASIPYVYRYLGPSVRLADGDLVAGAMEVAEGDFDFAGGRLEIGSFAGDLANMQAGELSVGEVHPSTYVAGSYSQGPGAALSITVAGSSALPLLQVDGDLDLDGALEVRPADGAVSFQAGDTVVLLGWLGDLTGTFAAVNIALPLAPGLAWDTSALYTTGEITVVTAS